MRLLFNQIGLVFVACVLSFQFFVLDLPAQEKKPIYYKSYLNMNSFMRPMWGAEVLKRYIDLMNKYGLNCEVDFTALTAQNIAAVRPDVIEYFKESNMSVGMHYRLQPRNVSEWMRETRMLNPLTYEVYPDKIGGVLAIQKIFDLTPVSQGRYLGELCRKNWKISPNEVSFERGMRLVNADYIRGEALQYKEETDWDKTTEPYIKIYRLRRELAAGIKTYHPYRAHQGSRLRERQYVLLLWLTDLNLKGFDISSIKGLEKFITVEAVNLNINDWGQIYVSAQDYEKMEIFERENAVEACRIMDEILEQCERLTRKRETALDVVKYIINSLDRSKENTIRFAMHDTDFYSFEDFGERTYSVSPGSPISKIVPARVRPLEEQERIWALFEELVAYCVNHPEVTIEWAPYCRSQHLPENNPLIFYRKQFGVNTYDDMLNIPEPQEARDYQRPQRRR